MPKTQATSDNQRSAGYQQNGHRRDTVDRMTDGILKVGKKVFNTMWSMSIWQWMIVIALILTLVIWLFVGTRILLFVIASDAIFFIIGYKGIPDLKKRKLERQAADEKLNFIWPLNKQGEVKTRSTEKAFKDRIHKAAEKKKLGRFEIYDAEVKK